VHDWQKDIIRFVADFAAPNAATNPLFDAAIYRSLKSGLTGASEPAHCIMYTF
jgi:hypothetical protein